MKMIAAAVLAVFALSTACGSERDSRSERGNADRGISDPNDPVTMTPEPGSDVHDVGGRPQRVRPSPGMADVRAVPWEKARQTPSGRSLRITYWSGVEPCNVLDHVDVDYRASSIVVTVYEGHDPEAEDVACIEVALRKVVRIPLEEPVEGRKLVDGA